MANPNCTYCQGTGIINQYSCQCNYSLNNQGILPQINGTILNGRAPFKDLAVDNKSVELYKTVIRFMKDNDIGCEDTIHQCDWVIENAYDFITDLFNIVRDDLDIKEDE